MAAGRERLWAYRLYVAGVDGGVAVRVRKRGGGVAQPACQAGKGAARSALAAVRPVKAKRRENGRAARRRRFSRFGAVSGAGSVSPLAASTQTDSTGTP